MQTPKSDLPQGTLDLLILQVAALEPIHGYAIAQRIQQISRDALQVQQGSLYPALHRLENKGFLAAEWQQSDTGREAKGTVWLDSTLQDLRFSLRVLRKSPAFSIAAISTLALGIGANTAIFQLLDAVRLRNLPVPNPRELVRIQIRDGNHGFGITN